MTYYYYAIENEELGPFTFDELKTKKITKETLVWKEGLTSWVPAKDMIDLKEIIITKPPPLPISFGKKETDKVKNIFIKKPKDKFDLSYEKELGASHFGFFILILNFFFYIFFLPDLNSSEVAILKLLIFLFRIFIIFPVIGIAKRQNRNKVFWGIFAFVLPPISLIIIGLQRKLKFKLVLDDNLSEIEQIRKLRQRGNKFIEENNFNDAKTIFEYISNQKNNVVEDKFNLAVVYFHLRNLKTSKSLIQEIQYNSSLSYRPYYYLGYIYLKNKDVQQAKGFLQLGIDKGCLKCKQLLSLINKSNLEIESAQEIKEKYGTKKALFRMTDWYLSDDFQVFPQSFNKNISINFYNHGLLFSNERIIKKNQNLFLTFFQIKSFEVDIKRVEIILKVNDSIVKLKTRFMQNAEKAQDTFNKLRNEFLN